MTDDVMIQNAPIPAAHQLAAETEVSTEKKSALRLFLIGMAGLALAILLLSWSVFLVWLLIRAVHSLI